MTDADTEAESQNSSQKAILQPLRTDYLPEPAADAPLFLPAGAQRMWYLGFLEHWKDFRHHATKFWNSESYKSYFDKIKDYTMELPHVPIAQSTSNDGPDKVREHFGREVLEIVDHIYNKLLTTQLASHLQPSVLPRSIGISKDIQIVKDDTVPSLFGMTTPDIKKDETRFIGHVEYLGGRSGALTRAIEEAAKNTWGSLRCVLGDIALWMLETHTSYGFIVSSDEVMFIRLDIDTRTQLVNIAPPTHRPRFEHVDVLIEPRIWFSDPIKYTDVLNEGEGTISVRLALMFLVHSVLTNEWQLPEEQGRSARYFKKFDAGERYRVPRQKRRRPKTETS